jgi:tRNA threonylcarbamoyladenosine biosynthesis protein TsaB
MSEFLPLLAIETSDNICSACIYFNAEKYFSSKVILKHSHSEKIFDVIDSVIAQSGISKNDIRSIAVSAGPGSFTGLRIGMAAAKGIAQALNIPIIPVPTFEAFALQIRQYLPDNASFIIANKVGRDELYYAKFQIKANNYIFKEDLKIVPISDFVILNTEEKIFGNLDKNVTGKILDITNISAPDSEYIAQWAAKSELKNLQSSIDFIEPNYLKDFIVKEKKI